MPYSIRDKGVVIFLVRFYVHSHLSTIFAVFQELKGCVSWAENDGCTGALLATPHSVTSQQVLTANGKLLF